MATLYVRDVPAPVYERLRDRARRNGRSLNAEVLEILGAVADEDVSAASITDALAALAREIDWPADAPKPEEWIREARDAEDPRRL